MKKSIGGGNGGTGGNLPGTPGTNDATKTNPNARPSKTLNPKDPPQPQNPIENWRETDKVFHQMVAEDKKNFASGKGVKRSQSLPAGGGGLGVGIVEVEVVVVVESVSLPNLGPGGVITIHKKPFDYNSVREFDPPDYSKYVQCPKCGRKFEEWTAARHIPQCKGYDFNKDEKEQFKRSKSKSK